MGSFSLQPQGQAAARSRAGANDLAHTGPIRTPVSRPRRMVALAQTPCPQMMQEPVAVIALVTSASSSGTVAVGQVVDGAADDLPLELHRVAALSEPRGGRAALVLLPR